jgi:paraquat-inducible protein B
VNLVSETSGSLGVGDPVLYRGYTVGRVESTELDVASREVRYSIFIDAPYDDLVTNATRFWNASGISAEVNADGANLSLASFETLIAGGVAFDLPDGATPGGPVQTGETFQLLPDESSVDERPHRYHEEYVVSFSQSVRGLSGGAPVTFRGIQVGTVERIMVREGTAGALNGGREAPIPVLIRLEPGRFQLADSPAGVENLRGDLARAVENGLRGTLESGSLITGSLYVNFDFFADAAPASLGEFDGHPAIPTISGGLARLQQQVGRLLAKLNELPLERSVDAATATLAELEASAAGLRGLLERDDVKALPERLEQTLDNVDATLAAYADGSGLPQRLDSAVAELERTLRSVRAVAETLERDPSAVIFPGRPPADPEPRAGQP